MSKKIIYSLVFSITFAIISPALAEARIAFETDSKGKVIQGSYEELLGEVRSCAELKLGLGTETYNEIVFLQSVLITKNSIIGIQTSHTSWNADSPKAPLYKAAYMVSTNRKDCIVRYNLYGEKFDLRPTRGKDRYIYYRWYTGSDNWIQVYSSDDKNGEKEKLLIKMLEKSGRDIKVSFELNGVTYILEPYIIVFPKRERYPGERMLPYVRTYPTLIIEDEAYTDIYNWKNMDMVEFFLNISGDIAILNHKQFKNIRTLKDRIINRIKEIFFASPYITRNIKYIKLKSPVKWFVRMNKEDLMGYQIWSDKK